MNLKKKPFSELVIGIICMVLGAAVFIAAGNLQTVKLGIGPAGMPKFDVDKRAASLFAAAVAMSVAYVLLVDTIGFLIMTPLLGRRKGIKSKIISGCRIAPAAFIYVEKISKIQQIKHFLYGYMQFFINKKKTGSFSCIKNTGIVSTCQAKVFRIIDDSALTFYGYYDMFTLTDDKGCRFRSLMCA